MGKLTGKPQSNSHEVEKFTSVVETAKDQVSDFVPDFFEQLVGFSLGKGGSENSSAKPLEVMDPVLGNKGDIFHAAKHKSSEHNAGKQHYAEKAPRNEKREAAIDHSGNVLRSSENASHNEMREVNQKLQQIMVELQRLISSSKVLKMEFADVNVDQAPPSAGEYHINFFDWLLLTIRTAREKVEDSGAWLTAVKGKNNKKGYWGMFKKHGTTFGLSNERNVATQTG
jgi:hypothetical protein